MIEFGKPIEIVPGLMVMWGNRVSCTVSPKYEHPKREQDKFVAAGQGRIKEYGLESLWCLNQEHTVGGIVLEPGTYPLLAPSSSVVTCFAHDQACIVACKEREQRIPSGMHLLSDDGDYLITREPLVGLSVVTADCLPIVFFDTVQAVVAIAHAGWKGSVQGVAPVTLRQMHHRFGTKFSDVLVWFGPHAKQCCYEVTAEFSAHLFHAFVAEVIEERDGKLFFANARYNELLLLAAGLQSTQISMEYVLCTMCQPGFHSRRKDGPLYIGQSTVAWLVNSK